MQPYNFRAQIVLNCTTTVTLLAIATGCSSVKWPQTSSSPASAAPLVSPVVSIAPSPIVSPLPQIDFLKRAETKALGAESIAQSAQSLDDWNLVRDRLQQAIVLLKSVPKSHPKKAFAEKKIVEYQKRLAIIQQKASGNVQPKTFAEASQSRGFVRISTGCSSRYD